MRPDELIDAIAAQVGRYLDNIAVYDQDTQLRINPLTLAVALVSSKEKQAEIAESIENVESAAGAEGAYTDDSMEYQASQNPDFYPVRTLIVVLDDGSARPYDAAIKAVAKRYF